MGINRFKFSEISVDRVIDGFSRRLKDIPFKLAWQYSSFSMRNKEQIELFRDKHLGKRCFIIGNGPSLNKMDLNHLRNEITFGLNRIYLLFDHMKFIPSYYVCVNELVLDQFGDEISKLHIPKFVNWNRYNRFSGIADLYFLQLSLSIKDYFGTNLTEPVCGGGTVTFIALQIAFYMGFNEVILIGVDHNFFEKGVPNTTQARTEDEDRNHFTNNYFPKGVKWQLPDLYRSELAYLLARKVFEEKGRRIIDSTVGGKLNVFEKVSYESLF
jgi:hypothetical protein